MKLLIILLVLASRVAIAQYQLQDAFPNLPKFTQPTEIQFDENNNVYVLEQNGKIYIFPNDSQVLLPKVFLDLSKVVTQTGPAGETGLLGLALHPVFNNFGFFYVNYTTGSGSGIVSHISRFQANSSDTVLNSTEFPILTLNQPPYPNHKGGHLAFAKDGYLYASFGDGGSGGDPQNRAQNTDSLFGKILRIDIDNQANGLHYSIPPDNPFAQTTGTHRKEIYAWGLRNVWKFSFDRTTGKLWAGDVGQAKYEEIDTISLGGNYGWNKMEGFHCYPADGFTCDSTGFTPPLWEYNHNAGDVAVIGGYVYRGSRIPSLIGKYIYGDYSSNRIWALTYEGMKSPVNQLLIDKSYPPLNTSTIGEDYNHELYVVGYSTGRIYKLAPTANSAIVAHPSELTLHISPNPFSSHISVRYSHSQTEFVKLSLYDILGNEITTLVETGQEAGTSVITIDNSNLPVGIYILRLATGSAILSEKIIKE